MCSKGKYTHRKEGNTLEAAQKLLKMNKKMNITKDSHQRYWLCHNTTNDSQQVWTQVFYDDPVRFQTTCPFETLPHYHQMLLDVLLSFDEWGWQATWVTRNIY